MPTAASTAVSNVVWMIGTKASWHEAANCSSESTVRLPDQHSADRLPTFSRHFLLSVSINLLDKADAPLIPDVHTCLLGVQFVYLTLRRPRGVYLPSLQHPCGSKTTRMFSRTRACTGSTQRYYAALKRASPGYATNCA